MEDGMSGFATPIDTLGLSPEIVEALKNSKRKVQNFGTLCCLTLGELKECGLETSQIGEILAIVMKK